MFRATLGEPAELGKLPDLENAVERGMTSEPTELSNFITALMLDEYEIGTFIQGFRSCNFVDAHHSDISAFIAGILAQREAEIAAIFERAEAT